MANKQWLVEAVGTDNGRAALFLRCQDTEGPDKQSELIVPTNVITMSTLAGKGFAVRHTNQVAQRRRNL